MKPTLLFLLLFLPWSLQAEEAGFFKEGEKALEQVQQKTQKAWNNLQAPPKSALQPFLPNYFLLYGRSSIAEGTRQAQEAQFQLSLSKEITELYGWRLVGAYTQNSFWQLFNQADSRPFRETNYAPQLFIQTPFWGQGVKWALETGYLHQSNGGREPYSRSWDRSFLGYEIQGDGFRLRQRFWHRLQEQPKAYAGDPKGDENPDILDFYGMQEARLQLWLGPYHAYLMERYNFTTTRGATKVMLTGPIPKSSLDWMLFSFQGYGESLIDYNRSLSKIGLGIVFARPHSP